MKEEYSDLNKLREQFEKKPNIEKKEIKKPNRIRKNRSTKDYTLQKSLIFTKKYSKKIFRNIFLITKKITKTTIKIVKIKIENAKKEIEEFNKFNREKKAYKIVETKKEKRNKIIIVRRRVPIEKKINLKKLNFNPQIYYYQLKPEENKICEKKIIGHTRLKESIWDFPMKK